MSLNVGSENCIFCKIVKGAIPAKKLYEDGEFLAFMTSILPHPSIF